jgi:hypothetical protein
MSKILFSFLSVKELGPERIEQDWKRKRDNLWKFADVSLNPSYVTYLNTFLKEKKYIRLYGLQLAFFIERGLRSIRDT